jgi:Nuclease-related domain
MGTASQDGKPVGSLREFRLKYAGVCTACQKRLSIGTLAEYDFSTAKVRCIECADTDDPGTPGGSALREFERRKSKRAAKARSFLQEAIGGAILATNAEPQSTLAWAQGAHGEQKLAQILTGIPGIKLLNDREIPQTRANLDHIVVAPAGVFVIDAKLRHGLIQIRNVGTRFSNERLLFVGFKNRSSMADKVIWQVELVRRALVAAGLRHVAPIVPVICFVDGTWPADFVPPQQFNGVWLEDGGTIARFLSGKPVLDADLIAGVHHVLARAFPPN